MSNIRYEMVNNRANVVLDGRVDIRNATHLQQALLDAVATECPILINCETADWLDTSCLQLILAAHRSAPGRVTVRATAESSVRHWLEQSGFAKELTLA